MLIRADGDTEMFFDWNGNGRKDDLFDDYMDYQMFKHATEGSGSNSGRGCCGTCCLYMLLVPAGIIGLIYGIVHLLA